GRGRLLPLDTGSVRSVDRRDVIRSTIDSGITGSLRCRHSAGIQGTPPFNYAAAGDGAVVGVRCGVVLMVVTSTGLRSTGGSLSQGFRSVRSCSALLFGDRAARYVVVIWSGVDVLANFLRVVRGAVVSVVGVWSGVDVLTNFLRVVRGAVAPVVVVWSGVDVLTDSLPVVRGAVVSVVVVWSGVDVLTDSLPVVRGAVVCVVTILYGVDVLSMAQSTQSSFLATATMARFLP